MIRNQEGQSLIEAVVALGAAVIIVAAITIVVITSVNNTDFSKDQNLATQYARQGLEIMRQKSEADWASFSSTSSEYCLDQATTTLTPYGIGCSANINNEKGNPYFKRVVSVAQGDPGCGGAANVYVSVSWEDGKCAANTFCHEVKLNTCLANLNNITTP